MANVSGFGTAAAAYWFQFFLDAGIPPSDAGNYAVKFTENRIQQDMIVDLTKEYLSEMGINVLGDMIAILKHAKNVHTQATREKVLKGSGLSSVPIATSIPIQISPHHNPTVQSTATAAARKASAPVLPSRPVYEVAKPAKSLAVIVPPLETAALKPMQQRSSVSLTSEKVVKSPNTTQIVSGVKRKAVNTGSVVRLKQKATHEVSVPTVRRLTPEQEGRYNIILPAGTTKKTQKIMNQQQKKVKTLSSVFDRLGEESQDVIKVVSSSPKTGGSKAYMDEISHLLQNSSSKTQTSTVFSRLGDQTKTKGLKRRMSEDSDDDVDISQSITQPVMKKAKKSIEERLGPVKVSLKPSSSSSAGILSGKTDIDNKPVHLRLGGTSSGGIKKAEGPVGGAGFQRRKLTTTVTSKYVNVTTRDLSKRLGPPKSEKLTIHLQQSQSPGGAIVRKVGTQKLGGVTIRLGVPKNKGNVIAQMNTAHALNKKQSSSLHLSKQVEKSTIQTTVVNKGGVFSRLGAKVPISF